MLKAINYSGIVLFILVLSLSCEQTDIFGYSDKDIQTFIDSRDDHKYKYREIGTQTWMLENMAYLPELSKLTDDSYYLPRYYIYKYTGNDLSAGMETDSYKDYGVLYNWEGAKTACPSGWHLPTDKEWQLLEVNMGMNLQVDEFNRWRMSGDVGRKLKSSEGWYGDGNGTDSVGFKVLPGHLKYEQGFSGQTEAHFWTLTSSSHGATSRVFEREKDGIRLSGPPKNSGLSVRCVKDAIDAEPPFVSSIIQAHQDTLYNGYTLFGIVEFSIEITDNIGINRVEFRYKTEDTSELIRTLSLSVSTGKMYKCKWVTNRIPDNSYTIEVEAWDNYGNSDLQTIDIVLDNKNNQVPPDGYLDYEGHSYPFRTIGSQTWMLENLANVPSIGDYTESSDTDPLYYVFNYHGSDINQAKASVFYDVYGALYNWEAAQKACPPGWHLPSTAEWAALKNYFGDSSSRKMTSKTDWEGLQGTDEGGFNVLPGGYRNERGVFVNGTSAFWTSEVPEYFTTIWEISPFGTNNQDSSFKPYGYSIRCVKE